MKSIILLGNGGHCKSCIDIIESSNIYQIKGIITNSKDNSKSFMNYKVLGKDENLDEYFEDQEDALICVGQIKSPDIRIKLFNRLINHKISLATVISKLSIISSYCSIDMGSIVMHHAIINSGAKVGKNCILNTKSLIEHDVKIGDHCHISTGAILNGGVNIGDKCFIGSGSIVREGVHIGDSVIVSAGQIVMEDIPSNTIYKR